MNPTHTATLANHLNGKLTNIGARSKKYLNEEKEEISKLGMKALDEAETVTTDLLNQIRSQISDFTSYSMNLIRKNPAIAISAAITIGLIIAKMASGPKSTSASSRASSH